MASLNPGHQTLLFSATMPVEIEALASQYLNKPVTVKVRLDAAARIATFLPTAMRSGFSHNAMRQVQGITAVCPDCLQVGQVSTPTANVLQGLQKTTEVNKTDDVVLLLLEEQHQAQQNGHTMPLTVVFVERKVRGFFHKYLTRVAFVIRNIEKTPAGTAIRYMLVATGTWADWRCCFSRYRCGRTRWPRR